MAQSNRLLNQLEQFISSELQKSDSGLSFERSEGSIGLSGGKLSPYLVIVGPYQFDTPEAVPVEVIYSGIRQDSLDSSDLATLTNLAQDLDRYRQGAADMIARGYQLKFELGLGDPIASTLYHTAANPISRTKNSLMEIVSAYQQKQR